MTFDKVMTYMARLYQEHQKHLEQNPLYQLSLSVADYIQNSLDEIECADLFSGSMSLLDFSNYLVFESVAQDIRDKQQANTAPLHHYVQLLVDDCPNDRSIVPSDIAATYKLFDRDLPLRKNFVLASVRRSNVPWVEYLNWIKERKKRPDYRKGYRLTPLQFEQLHDRQDFFIKKVHELRRFINPKHAPIADVKAYYTSLVNHAQECLKESDPQKRVMHAINLNDFESRNPAFFLVKVAEQCEKTGITHIDAQTECLLLALTAIISQSSNGYRWLVTHKPVLFIDRYISTALNHDLVEINRYINLVLWGLQLRLDVIPNMLKDHPYTYEDFDAFIQAPSPFSLYNVFALYSEPNWDEKGKTISILRTLIDKLTVDPLS